MSLDGAPYVVPLNYAYAAGKVLFHCALTGRKLDYLKTNPQVCFAVGHQVGDVGRHSEGDPCHQDNDSVICYGIARVIGDLEERGRALNDFNQRLRPGSEEISLEEASKCLAVEITITEMTARQERDKKRTYWRHRFQQ